MYLSRLRLNQLDKKVQQMLADPYRQHQAVMLAFPSGDKSRVLYRIEPENQHGTNTWLVQSESIPDWEKPGIKNDLPLVGWEMKEFEPTFVEGRQYRFRLRANPTVKRDGKRWAIKGEEGLSDWLNRKFSDCGSELEGRIIIPEGQVQGSRRTRDGSKKRLTFMSVRFEGMLTVLDPAQFVQLVNSGVGSGKAFGFGLLSLAKA